MRVKTISQLSVVSLYQKTSSHADFVMDSFGLIAQIAQMATITFSSLYTLVSIIFDLRASAKR